MKQRKKILVLNYVCTEPEQENYKKKAKKIKKLKNLFPALFLAKMGGVRPKKREKKNLVPNSVHTWPGEENSGKK